VFPSWRGQESNQRHRALGERGHRPRRPLSGPGAENSESAATDNGGRLKATGRSAYAELNLKAVRGELSRPSQNVPAQKPLFHGQPANASVSWIDGDIGSSGFV